MGSDLTLTPKASLTALPIAGAMGRIPNSPTEREPKGPGPVPLSNIIVSILGESAAAATAATGSPIYRTLLLASI